MSDLVTFIVCTYNQEKFIQNAILGALNQTYSPLEIIISDDCSSDSTWEVVLRTVSDYQGPHRIITNRNKVNLGINKHFNKIVGLSNGQFIVASAGDDISRPERTAKLVGAWHKGACGVFSNAVKIDPSGIPHGLFRPRGHLGSRGWEEMIRAGDHGAWGCTFAWDRKVFNLFGELPTEPLGEDAFIPFRCALAGGIAYLDEELVQYRDHGGNVSFWAKLKTVPKEERLKLGVSMAHFRIDLWRHWQNDLVRAAELNLIAITEANSSRVKIEKKLRFKKIQLSILKKNVLSAACLYPFTIAYGSTQVGFRYAFFNSINSIIRFKYYKLYKLLFIISKYLKLTN